MQNKSTFIILATALPKWKELTDDARKALGAEHVTWLQNAVRQNKLLLAGPLNIAFMKEADKIIGMPSGLFILNIQSYEEAVDLAQNEPFHKAGYRQNIIHSFEINFLNNTLINQINATQ